MSGELHPLPRYSTGGGEWSPAPCLPSRRWLRGRIEKIEPCNNEYY